MLQELDKLLKDAKAGKTVNEDDIPPPVFVKGMVAASDGPAQVQSSQDSAKQTHEEVEKPAVNGKLFQLTYVWEFYLVYTWVL